MLTVTVWFPLAVVKLIDPAVLPAGKVVGSTVTVRVPGPDPEDGFSLIHVCAGVALQLPAPVTATSCWITELLLPACSTKFKVVGSTWLAPVPLPVPTTHVIGTVIDATVVEEFVSVTMMLHWL